MSINEVTNGYAAALRTNNGTTSIRAGGIEDSKDSRETLRHPLGVRPSGNALTAVENIRDFMGNFGHIPDVMVLLLLEYLEQESLMNLGSTCRGLFAYCSCDQLWRDLAVDSSVLTGQFRWRGSWRSSLRNLRTSSLPRIDCRNLFSDALHRPFLCSQISLQPYFSRIPAKNEIARLEDLSANEFHERWTDQPFILTRPVKRWQLFEKWCQDELLRDYGSVVFRAEAVDWPLNTYVNYMNDNQDESPLYLFDRSFVEKMNLSVGPAGSYEPPSCFGEDLFMLLGDQRPDHRWLIIGPERSGSTFHKDPNATSAWNAVVRGSKYWIMFPSAILPPGVIMSDDESEVTSPLSIAEWLLTFHAEARSTSGCIEGICSEGEVLHVPSGWWHLVVNLEPAIAITQNFVPRGHLHHALNFLKNKSNQTSGFKDDIADPHALFRERLEECHPDLVANVLSSSKSGPKKRKWEEVVTADDHAGEKTGGFSFGFGSDIEEEDV